MISNAEILHGNSEGHTHEVEVGYYPNKEPFIKIPEPWSKPFPSIHRESIILRPKTIDSFMAAMFYVDALQERRYLTPHLIFPFALGARQDRLNTSGDFLFTAKSIAKEINMRNFPSVTVVDCHSEVMPALIDRCRNVSLASLIKTPNFSINGKMYDGIISPDAGADKRASAVATKLGLPLFHAWKKRNVTTGALDGFGCESLLKQTDHTRRYLIVDDICDGGGTFIGLAKHIARNEEDCDLDLLVTHGIFSQGIEGLSQWFDIVYTTDSIIRHITDQIHQIDICEPLLRGQL